MTLFGDALCFAHTRLEAGAHFAPVHESFAGGGVLSEPQRAPPGLTSGTCCLCTLPGSRAFQESPADVDKFAFATVDLPFEPANAENLRLFEAISKEKDIIL